MLFFKTIKRFFLRIKNKPGRVFVISDTHFHHGNIIQYCKRPFKNEKDMNQKIMSRWNKAVKKKDQVYFLGDLVHWKYPVGFWITHLNGKKIFIEGNHDVLKNADGIIVKHKIKGAIHHKVITYGGIRFYLVHHPDEIFESGYDWIIHGHTHNNNLEKYPFIDGEKRRINVSVEVIDYRPISLDYLLSLNLPSIKEKKTIHTPTIYW